jgi:hypothetical protein
LNFGHGLNERKEEEEGGERKNEGRNEEKEICEENKQKRKDKC